MSRSFAFQCIIIILCFFSIVSIGHPSETLAPGIYSADDFAADPEEITVFSSGSAAKSSAE